jgi:hypothetical protein
MANLEILQFLGEVERKKGKAWWRDVREVEGCGRGVLHFWKRIV